MSATRPPMSLPRLLLVLLLAACTIGAPALSFAAEIHDSVGHASGHAHDHGDVHEDDAGTPEGPGGNALHQVMHVAACCGHACAVLPALLSFDGAAARHPPDVRSDARAPSTPTADPLRPPIDA